MYEPEISEFNGNLSFTLSKRGNFDEIDKEKELLVRLKTLIEEKGISLEALYKICRGSNTGTISADEFITSIQNLKIPLKEYQIRKIIVLIDENCTGNILYDEYIQTIEAYGLRAYKPSGISYCESCAAKLIGVLQRKEIELNDFFRMVATSKEVDKKGFANLNNVARVLKGLNSGLLHREIRGIISCLDVNIGQPISKEDFLKVMKNAEIIWKQTGKKPILAWKQNIDSGYSEKEQNITEIIEKMENTGISSAELVGLLGQIPSLSLGKVVSKIAYCYPDLNKEERLLLGKSIPVKDGNVDLHELLLFLHKYSIHHKDKPVNIYFDLWANYIKKTSNMAPTEYFRKQGLKSNSELSYEWFSKKLKQTLGLGGNIGKIMWKSLVEVGEELLVLEDLLQVLESYMELQIIYKQVNFIDLLAKANYTLLDIFNQASENQENSQATAITVLRAFRRILPNLDPEIIRNKMKEKKITDLTMNLNYEKVVEIFGEELQGENIKAITKRDSIYWINKLDNAMLEIGMAPTAIFQKIDIGGNKAVSVNSLCKLFADLLTEEKYSHSDLLQTMKVLDVNKNGMIEFDEFAKVFKNARSSSIIQGKGRNNMKTRLPIFGNPIFINVDKEPEIMEESIHNINPIEKLKNSKLNFCDCIEKVKWDTEGKVTTHYFMSCLETLFGSCLIPKERLEICKNIDMDKTGFICANSLQKFYNQNVEIFLLDEKVFII